MELGLVTDRIRLRPLESADAAGIVRLLGRDQEAVLRTAAIPWPVEEEASRRWIAARKGKAANAFTVLRREDGEFLGGAGFSLGQAGSEDEGVAEIGYWIGRPHWNQGYASEAVGLLLGLAASLGAVQASARVFPSNRASERVLVKNGFELIGEEQGDYPRRGGRRIVVRYERVL